jgi:hypothetical protein
MDLSMAVKLIKKSVYPPHVTKRLDPTRPRYSNAVKSIAAFAQSAEEFEVLVTHLNDACKEAREHNLSRLPNLIRLK